jgi:hypothetical protein
LGLFIAVHRCQVCAKVLYSVVHRLQFFSK